MIEVVVIVILAASIMIVWGELRGACTLSRFLLEAVGVIAIAFVSFIVLLPSSGELGRVVSDSMEPALGVGDLVKVDFCELEDIKEGDVVVYADGTGEKVIHRAVLCRDDEVLVKGDNNDYIDEEHVTEDNLVGKVTGVIFKN